MTTPRAGITARLDALEETIAAHALEPTPERDLAVRHARRDLLHFFATCLPELGAPAGEARER